ncbi:MAG TPA: M1 family aminopeptidase, partial [Kofleriaceae bacterium]|nr:M1 family aminopeptidase [Kofleriaceae bacterium]
MRVTLVAIGLVACGGGDPGPTGLLTATVTHYDYTFDVDSRAAHSTVTATVDTPGNCFELPFRASAFDGDTALVDGEPFGDGSIVTNTSVTLCGRSHAIGDTITIDGDMTVPASTIENSQVGYSVTPDRDGNELHYLVSWVDGCDKFGPCDNRPDQFATYHFDVTHSADLMVACPGDIVEDSTTETECTFDFEGGPTYSTFGLAAYPRVAWPATDEGMWGGVHVTVYDRASTGITAAIDPAYHAGYLTWMQSQLGPFPFGSELRVLTAPTYWSGFEHPGNIMLDDNLASEAHPIYADNVQHVLDHEMAHQWAGDQTTLADTYDFVWKESMAEYFAYVYEDMTRPATGAVTSAAWKELSSTARFFPVPDDKPDLFTYYGDVYGPGPMVLFRQLEALTSRDAVLAALKMVLGTPHALSVDELVSALEITTGLDLGAYTAAWIHGTGRPVWPTVQLTFTPATPTATLAVHVATASNRLCKFHVALHGANA